MNPLGWTPTSMHFLRWIPLHGPSWMDPVGWMCLDGPTFGSAPFDGSPQMTELGGLYLMDG